MSLTDRRASIGSLVAASATPLASTQGLADQNNEKSGADQSDVNDQMTRSPADRSSEATFTARDDGATGRRSDDAKASIQKAINACAAAGGGTVYSICHLANIHLEVSSSSAMYGCTWKRAQHCLLPTTRAHTT
jgi:hypothetical protein